MIISGGGAEDQPDRCRRFWEKRYIVSGQEPKCILCEGKEGRDSKHIVKNDKCNETIDLNHCRIAEDVLA